MREIKFRVHCASTGKILAYEVFNTNLNWGYYWLDASVPEEDQVCSAGIEYFKHPDPMGELNRILYTGKKDKNNVEIYEFDVIKSCRTGLNYKVVWDNEAAEWIAPCTNPEKDFYKPPRYWNESEIIGSLCKNPELIETKKGKVFNKDFKYLARKTIWRKVIGFLRSKPGF